MQTLQKNKLIDEVIAKTNLPDSLIRNEIYDMIKKAGLNEEDLTMEQLRTVVAEYMYAIFDELLCQPEQKTAAN